MKLKPFHQRREERLAVVANPEPMTLAELLAKDFPPSSENRLESLPADSWSPSTFRERTIALRHTAGLVVDVGIGAQAPQDLTPDVMFKYADDTIGVPRHAEGAEPIIVTVTEGNRIIAYGYGFRQVDSPNSISVIDVDLSSRRSSGLQLQVAVGGQDFGVGVGHVLADALITALPVPIEVDATNATSRYIFKSFGFRQKPSSKNPCLLWLGSITF